ncbi:hypothetical protein M8J75_011916 [Diaphorina citri]|nr:hypothetical protein M8J75_011916 [Diaphorina citri]KAI5754104.1 hypothetical protein M8J77_005784 [Diaphorina citri]
MGVFMRLFYMIVPGMLIVCLFIIFAVLFQVIHPRPSHHKEDSSPPIEKKVDELFARFPLNLTSKKFTFVPSQGDGTCLEGYVKVDEGNVCLVVDEGALYVIRLPEVLAVESNGPKCPEGQIYFAKGCRQVYVLETVKKVEPGQHPEQDLNINQST